jgi:hypothetical protein
VHNQLSTQSAAAFKINNDWHVDIVGAEDIKVDELTNFLSQMRYCAIRRSARMPN